MLKDDKIRPLMKAIAGLPVHHTGLMLGVVKELSGANAEDARDVFIRALESLKKPLVKAVTAVPLVIAGMVSVSATSNKFFAYEKFVINIETTRPVKRCLIGAEFHEWFILKTEKPFAGSSLRYGDLVVSSSDDHPSITKLGSEENAETTLTEVWSMIEMQGYGQKGALLTNHHSNVFFVRDANNKLRIILVNWDNDGWLVHANEIDDPRFCTNPRVFSRNPDPV